MEYLSGYKSVGRNYSFYYYSKESPMDGDAALVGMTAHNGFAAFGTLLSEQLDSRIKSNECDKENRLLDKLHGVGKF